MCPLQNNMTTQNVLRKALEFEVEGRRKRGRPKRTWKKQVEEECRKVCLRKKDAQDRERKWREGVRDIATRIEVNPATSVYGDFPD